MRFLFMLLMAFIALMMAFVVFVSLPTNIGADVVEVSTEQTADSVDVYDGVSDADLTSCMEIAMALPASRDPLPEVTSTRTGPNGFSPGIWRPVTRIESVPHRNYESGLALNRRS